MVEPAHKKSKSKEKVKDVSEIKKEKEIQEIKDKIKLQRKKCW